MNGRGPDRKGPKTGRGLGNCKPNPSEEMLSELGIGQGKRRRADGSISGRGAGRSRGGSGRGRGMGLQNRFHSGN